MVTSARQLAQLLELAADAVNETSEMQWWPAVAAGVTGSLFSALVMAVNVVNPLEAFGWFRLVYPEPARRRMPLNSVMDDVLMREHPFSARMRAGQVTDPLKVTDLVDERRWGASPAAERMRHLTGGANHLIIHLPRAAPYVESVSIVRADRDFDQHEMQLAAQLQAVTQLAVRHFRTINARQERWGPLAEEEADVAAAAIGVTVRERVVLDTLASGSSTQQIADILGISPYTVYRHEQSLYRKLGVGDALNAVLRGQRLGLLPVRSGYAKRARVVTKKLTRREEGVLHLLATGMTNSSIAEALAISTKTVDIHVGALLRKLDARTRTEAVANALRSGLVS